jgi:hypothetical protein
MEFKGFSEQTSILILLGLGFVFFLGFSFYFFGLRNRLNLGIRFILGFLRATILLLLVVFVVPLNLTSLYLEEKSRQILLVDASPFIQKTQVDSVKRRLGQDFPNLEIIILPTSSWALSLDTLRALDRDLSVDQAFLLTDGQLTDVEPENNLDFPIHVIGIGPLPPSDDSGIYIPLNSIRTVVDELIYLPIDIWTKKVQANTKVDLQVWDGSRKLLEKWVVFEGLDAYQRISVPLQSSKLGLHTLVFKLGNLKKTVLNWQVLQEKAVVDGFARGAHPNVGIISTYAAKHFLKLNWHFGEDQQPTSAMKNIIFYYMLPKNLPTYLNRSVWYLGVDLPASVSLNSSSLHRKEVHFWEQQMDGYRQQKSFVQIDSMFQRMFAQTFLRNISQDSIQTPQEFFPSKQVLSGRDEATLTYLAGKEQVGFSHEIQKRVKRKSQLKSIPAWKFPYLWLVLVSLIFLEWGIRKRFI